MLAPHLPLAIPVPLAKGKPGEGFPWQWSVYRWIEGENATLDHLADPRRAAVQLAQFISALQRLDSTGGPVAGSHNFGRGLPLASRDLATRAAIAACHGLINTDAALAAWERDFHTPAWNGPPVWIHGDLQSGNLLANEGELTAVIDFGGLAVGDPATDLMVAWNLFPADIREVFRAEVGTDDASWARGRGWALSVAMIALPYYQQTNPMLADISRFAIEHVLADHAGHLGE
jgi:aminoglycoside phosphotransferase (APT) family kinase protein